MRRRGTTRGTRSGGPLRALGTVLLAVALATAARPAAAGVSLEARPSVPSVTPGSEFDLTLEVTAAGSAFNRFAAIVAYDTAALTLVPLVPVSQQEGCLLTGACSAACGTTAFHQFATGHDSIFVADGLQCSSGSLTGPGTLYRLRFRASSVPQLTTIRLLQGRCWNAGLIVSPVTVADATVGIGVPVGVGETPPRTRLSVRALPNPARGRTTFAVESDVAGERWIEIHDLAGRFVRRLDGGSAGAGTAQVAWDGRDRSGARVPPGVYLVTLRVADRAARTRLAIVD